MRLAGVLTAFLVLLPALAQADILVSISKSQQQMTVSIDGVPAYHWAVSTGRAGYDTPAGSFRAIRLERVYYSKKFDDAPMPNSVFFYGGYAIHGTYEESRLGRPASHGCVRLARVNAATLFELVRQRGMSNTRIVINDGMPRGYDVPSAMARQPQYVTYRDPRWRDDRAERWSGGTIPPRSLREYISDGDYAPPRPARRIPRQDDFDW